MSTLYASVNDFAIILAGADQALLAVVIEAVSRNIDKACGHQFYQTVETREFELNREQVLYGMFALPQTANPPDICPIDDLMTDGSETVTLDGTPLAPSQYEFHPLNGQPKSAVKLMNSYGYRVAITGTWGYCAAVPAQVKVVCMLLVRLTYQAIVDKQAKNERIGSYAVTYADIEVAPMPETYAKLLRSISKGKIQ